ncbi:MAG: GNAT family N-acetyltransferase [Caldilineaceae bacterium]
MADLSPADLAALRRILLTDPIWAIYAIADLQPAFAPYCHWSVVDDERGAAATLLFTALQPPILVMTGAQPATGAALRAMSLPDTLFVSVRRQNFALVEALYEFGDKVYPMVRMALPSGLAITRPTVANLIRLTRHDSERISALYQHGGPFTPDYFDPYQLDDGVFYGVEDNAGALIAVGGTHIITWTDKMAAIGNMYTHPEHRGQGHARAVLGAIIAELQAQDITTIVLNVDERNDDARRIYERYGFTPHCTYIEAEGVRRR